MWALSPAHSSWVMQRRSSRQFSLAAALRRVDRLVDREDHVGDRDRIGRPGEVVAAAGPADAVHETVPAQLAEQLLQVRQRDLLPLGDGR